MDSIISMTNGKRLAIKEWNSISMVEKLKDQVLTFHKISSILRQVKGLQLMRYRKVIEDYFLKFPNVKFLLDQEIIMQKCNLLIAKLRMPHLQCQEQQEILHSRSMVHNIQL